jgi:hypothetical protein
MNDITIVGWVLVGSGLLAGWALRTIFDMICGGPPRSRGRGRAVRLNVKRQGLPTARSPHRENVRMPVVAEEDPWGERPMSHMPSGKDGSGR